MNTTDIMESLKLDTIWRSNKPLPSVLVAAIEEGLNERDELKQALKWESQRVDALHLAQADDKDQLAIALAHIRAIVTANASYNDNAQELIDAELWLRKIDATD